MKRFLVFSAFYFTYILGNAQQITWAEHAAPIFYSNCVKCHNPNGVAPFELLTYQSAKDNKDVIKYMVSERKMPPWTPNPHYTRFVDERILRQGEIDTILAWVDAGAAEGEVSKAPTPPVFSSKNEISNPDLTLKIPDYTINTVTDNYRCFVIPYSIGTDKYITDLEIVPGNRSSVHHVLLYHDNTTIPENLDAKDAEAGYPCFGGTGSNNSTLIGGWVPGQRTQHLPTGIGIKLPANAKAILQIHYPAGKINELDSTKVLLKYTLNKLRNLYNIPILNHTTSFTNGPLIIPANTVKTFYAKETALFEGSLLQIAPHMHLIGKSIKVFGVTSKNDTIPFIHIPEWNFHWQGFYQFPKLLRIPAGTTLYSESVYDNTHNNHHNPNHLNLVDVKAGEATTDEMMVVYFSFLEYKAGDENIETSNSPLKVLGLDLKSSINSISTFRILNLSPNPSIDNFQATVYMPQNGIVTARIYDLIGHEILINPNVMVNRGNQTINIDSKNLNSGTYRIVFSNGESSDSKLFIKQ